MGAKQKKPPGNRGIPIYQTTTPHKNLQIKKKIYIYKIPKYQHGIQFKIKLCLIYIIETEK